MRFFFESVKSKSYWKYVLLSRVGLTTVFAFFGGIWIFIGALDFFKVYTRDQYGSYAFLIFLLISILATIITKRPIKNIIMKFPKYDFNIEVKIADIFKVPGAVMISTNTVFEADVAGGKIDKDSLQGQFTAHYFLGAQDKLIDQIQKALKKVSGPPYPMGTTIPINTHGKIFYFTVMSELNEQGTARSTTDDIQKALDGLWNHIQEAGEFQHIVVPIVGTGRGRLKLSRKRTIALIAKSFVKASLQSKFTDQLVIVVRPKDAYKFAVNLYDIKDHLDQVLFEVID